MDRTPEPTPDQPESQPNGGEPAGLEQDDLEQDGAEPGAAMVDDEHEIAEGQDPLRFNRWMKRSATGAMMTGISLGLREALENKKNEPAVMIEASGRPDDPNHPIRLHFDPDSPADTVAVIRRPADTAVVARHPAQPEETSPPG